MRSEQLLAEMRAHRMALTDNRKAFLLLSLSALKSKFFPAPLMKMLYLVTR
nr:hypothetical protein [Escherichia coli O25b:H4-ST131]